jgi:hypothetical protein
MRDVCNFLVGKPEGEGATWEDNIRMNLEEIVCVLIGFS